jgi:hypothetical protein
MTVYHVCSLKKVVKYKQSGIIKAPVRAWESLDEAERFAKQTSRRIILRLKFPADTPRLKGHRNKAYILGCDYKLDNF